MRHGGRRRRAAGSDLLAGNPYPPYDETIREDNCRRPLMKMTAVLTPDPTGGYSALNPETGTVSQGETVAEAVANLREAVALYLEEFPRRADAAASLVTTFELVDA